MSMQDPIADMLTRVRNAQMVNHPTVMMPHTGTKEAIAKVLLEEGFIKNFESAQGDDGHKKLLITLKYHLGKPVIEKLQRISRPGLRVYKGASDLPKVLGGFGVAVMSTPKGVMSAMNARKAGVGGEVLCYVW